MTSRFLALFCFLTVSCSPVERTLDQSNLTLRSPSVIKSHMAFLADDALEGRGIATRGEELAALYIATEFAKLELEHGAGDSFIQPVPLRATKIDLQHTVFEVEGDGQRMSFRNGDDIVIYGDDKRPIVNIKGDLVFAGHGIDAPELGMSDYDNLDVSGKIAVVLGGPPSFLPAAEAAHFGRSLEKQKAAARHGAIGVVRIYTPEQDAWFPFVNFRQFMESSTFSWRESAKENQVDQSSIPTFRLNVNSSKGLFSKAERTVDEVIEEGRSGAVKGFPLHNKASLHLVSTHDDALSSGNVAGLLEGSDPLLKEEVVVVTAHYDHVGICRPESVKDRICNGAIDNAFGVAAMLDVARQLSQSDQRPKRSILFLAVGAEEEGLLGSSYFVNHPTISQDKIIANINMDGGLPFYDFSDVIAFGGEQSEMGDWLAKAITPMGLSVASDPFPEESLFTRSDQYSFVKKGIPALFLYNGFSNLEGENVGREVWDDITSNHYHSPSDDLHLPIDYTVAAKYAEVFKRLLLETANAPARPLWYQDSVFGKRFAPDAPKTKKK
ncbi:MAG: M20/M25/M40 family metallo-hydrolase [Litorimonas sp.]